MEPARRGPIKLHAQVLPFVPEKVIGRDVMRGARHVSARARQASTSVQRVPCDLQAKADLTRYFLDDVDLIPGRVHHGGIARQAVDAAGTDIAMMLVNTGVGQLPDATISRGADATATAGACLEQYYRRAKST